VEGGFSLPKFQFLFQNGGGSIIKERGAVPLSKTSGTKSVQGKTKRRSDQKCRTLLGSRERRNKYLLDRRRDKGGQASGKRTPQL